MALSDLDDELLQARILVVDDNAANLSLLEGMLEEEGYGNVRCVSDSLEVVPLCKETPYDLILLDIRMPKMDGHQVIDALQEMTQDDYLPILVISAQTDMETRHRALSQGARDFINKPFDRHEVLQRIRNMLEVRFLYNERRARAVRLEAEVAARTRDLAEREGHLRAIMDHAAEVILTTDGEGRVQSINPAAVGLLGRSRAELIGIDFHTLISVSKRRLLPGSFFEVGLNGAGGRAIPVELSVGAMPETGGLILVGRDITDRLRAEEETRYLANHDLITGLPNRTRTHQILQGLLDGTVAGQTGAVLYLGLEGHERAAQNLGLEIAETLLREAGERLRQALLGQGSLGCWSEGAFIIMLPNAVLDSALAMAQNFMAYLREPFLIEGHELFNSSYGGMVLFPEQGRDPATLIRRAALAARHGLQQSPPALCLFRPEFETEAERRHHIERELRHAVQNDQLSLHYQPKVDLTDGRLVGFEALLRWTHPELGAVSPGVFVPIAEETGLIGPIGEWVMVHACRQRKQWLDAGHKDHILAVNLSGRQFDGGAVAEMVGNALKATGLPSPLLEVEVTESCIMRDIDHGLAGLQALQALGVKVAIDDFGTGYSSLAYLRRLPLNTLKIDRSFVSDVTTSKGDAAIARTIIAMGHTLGLRIIAEGIETEAQRQFLLDSGCQYGQGYLFHRPMTAEAMSALLDSMSSLC